MKEVREETTGQAINQITEGVIWKQLLIFFFPILFGTFFQQLYNTTDAVIVGNFVGKEALAAVGGPASTIINLLVGFFVGLSSGAGVVISQYYGSGDHKRLQLAVHTSMALAILGGALMMVLGLVSAAGTLRLLDTPEDIMADSITYMRIYFLGISCGINIVLDLFFVVVLDMAVAGVGIATVLSQVLSAVMTLFVLLRTRETYRVQIPRIRIHNQLLSTILYIGLPAGLQSAMYSISNLVIQAAINGYGTDTVAAWTAYGKVDSFFWMIMSAYGIAITTFAGQNFGAGKLDRVKKSVRVCLAMAAVTSIFFSILVVSGGHIILRLFTSDATVIDICMGMIRIVSPAYITYICIEILSGACRGCGDALMPMILTCFGVCILRVVWVLAIGILNPGVSRIVFSYPLTWTITSILFIIYYKKGKWMRYR